MVSKRKTRQKPPARFVLDCSVVFAWFFADEANSYADAVAESLLQTTAIVPSLWTLEVANTLIVGERRRRSTQAQADTFLSRLTRLPIMVDDETAQQAWSATLDLARQHVLSSYDACYLELALRKNAPLATLDENLKKVATKIGVSLYKGQ